MKIVIYNGYFAYPLKPQPLILDFDNIYAAPIKPQKLLLIIMQTHRQIITSNYHINTINKR